MIDVGLIVKDGRSYRLTERGERMCPNKDAFDALLKARHTLASLKSEATPVQDDKDALKVIRRMTPARLRVLGAIKHGPASTSVDVVRYICTRTEDPMQVANIYRTFKTLGKEGLINYEAPRVSLTERGERMCPDKETFERLLEAARSISDVNAGVSNSK
jgi:predicted transcriptional regulator